MKLPVSRILKKYIPNTAQFTKTIGHQILGALLKNSYEILPIHGIWNHKFSQPEDGQEIYKFFSIYLKLETSPHHIAYYTGRNQDATATAEL